MSLKEVYLKLGDRNKCVKFRPSAGKTDVDGLREALEVAKEKDLDLQRRMEGCSVVFQRLKLKKSTQQNVLVDIDDLEDIEDECDIVPVFCPILTSNIPMVFNATISDDGSCVLESDSSNKSGESFENLSADTTLSIKCAENNLISPHAKSSVCHQTPKSSASGYAKKGRKDQVRFNSIV